MKKASKGKSRRPAPSAGKSRTPARSDQSTKEAHRPAASKRAARKSAPPAARPRWKPEQAHDLVISLVCKEAVRAIDFYRSALGAREQSRMMSPDGKSVWHAELRIGDSLLFLNDEMPGSTTAAPGPGNKPTAALQLYVPDCDAVFHQAVRAGAKATMPLMDMFWGDRMGAVLDPFGHSWMISTRVRTLTPEELRKGGEEFAERMKQQGGRSEPGDEQR